MLFNSVIFLFVFLPCVMLACVMLRHRGTATLIKVLSLSSLIFYAWWKPSFIALIVLTIAANYALGQWLYRNRSRRLLALGIILNILPLAFFKYYNFAAEGIALLRTWTPPTLNLFLPLALSFLTFEQISYLVDCRRRTTTPTSFWDYAFFVSFFPKLIAGPIVRYNELQPQLPNVSISFANFAQGMTLFIIGLGKKVLLADSVTTYSDTVFHAAFIGSHITGVDAWMATFAYSAQIYFDFSGYSDMALGLALIFGIHLPMNFDSPYKSRSIIDFWRRWHMTLSRFLRDYLYISLGGARVGHARRYLNLTIVMLVGGLWHGAGVNFIIWGGLHALYLAINHFFRDVIADRLPRSFLASNIWIRSSWLLTFLAVTFAWIFFRSANLDAATSIFCAMARLSSQPGAAVMLTAEDAIAIAIVLGGALLLPNSMEIIGFKDKVSTPSPLPVANTVRWRASWVWALYTGAIAALSFASLSKPTPFLYFQF